jgi:hypothetical protein
VPEIWPEYVEWDHNNLGYATRRVSQREIDQVIANVPTYRVNRLGRAGDLVAFGKTDGGRRVVVVVVWKPDLRCVRPINAWEDR